MADRAGRHGGTSAHGDNLAVASPSAQGSALAAQLNALTPPERVARWAALVADANASAPVGDPVQRSGEMGWQNRDALTSAVADAVLHPLPGDAVVGPIVTAAGEELFLVRGQYLGPLDDHASAVLVQATTAASDADLVRIAAANAPGAEALLWDPGLTYSALELAGNDEASRALLDTPLGARSGPFALGGRLMVAVPMSRSSAVPTGEVLARVRVNAYDGLIASRVAALA